MTELNLVANDNSQARILAYLQENASDVLAEKINNGTVIEKDGKRLMNKKSLDGFMNYASTEARKLVEKAAKSVCVEDDVVFGWAIHYFEEKSIEGKLFNPDGTEYKPIVKVTLKQTDTKYESPKPQRRQTSLWDMLTTPEIKQEVTEEPAEEEQPIEKTLDGSHMAYINEDDDRPSVEDIADAIQSAIDEKRGCKSEPEKKIPMYYKVHTEAKKQYPQDIILTRLGDFYETFGEYAITLADELALTLTSKDVGPDGRIPLVGFPYHASDMYINKIRERHSVVVIENNETLRLSQIVRTDGKVVEVETGQVVDAYSPSAIDEQIMNRLYELFGNEIKVQ